MTLTILDPSGELSHCLRQFNRGTILGVIYFWRAVGHLWSFCLSLCLPRGQFSINTFNFAKHVYFWELPGSSCTLLLFAGEELRLGHSGLAPCSRARVTKPYFLRSRKEHPPRRRKAILLL